MTVRWRAWDDHSQPEFMAKGAVTMPRDGQVVLACGTATGWGGQALQDGSGGSARSRRR